MKRACSSPATGSARTTTSGGPARAAHPPGRQQEHHRRGPDAEERHPQPVGRDEVDEVVPPLRPMGAAGVLRQRGVGYEDPVVAHAEQLGEHRQGEEPTQEPGQRRAAGAPGREHGHDRRRAHHREIGSYERSEAEQHTDRRGLPRGGRRRIASGEGGEHEHERTDPRQAQPVLEPRGGPFPARGQGGDHDRAERHRGMVTPGLPQE